MSEIERRHQAAIQAGQNTYVDPTTGYQVLTAAWLAARGYCCGNGCRHCPYEPRHGGGTQLADVPELLRWSNDLDAQDHT